MWRWHKVGFYFAHLTAAVSTSLNLFWVTAEWEVKISACENVPVAVDLQSLLRTACWTSWILLPVRASNSSLPAATRGWYHCHVQRNWITFMYSFHITHLQEVKFPFVAQAFVTFLFFSMHPLPFLSVCISSWHLLPVVHIRTLSCLKSLKSCRWVTGTLIVWLCAWRLSGTSCLSSLLYLSIRAAGLMSSGVNSLFLWRLAFNLKICVFVGGQFTFSLNEWENIYFLKRQNP